jgi:AraC family transcriptional regulator, regulatory protein of adaptative response / methylated-DNA-[protein]-cysteine methyltransferase
MRNGRIFMLGLTMKQQVRLEKQKHLVDFAKNSPKYDNGLDLLSQIIDAPETVYSTTGTCSTDPKILHTSQLDTPLGPMIAIGDDQGLYLLQFIDGKDFVNEVKKLKTRTSSRLQVGMTDPIRTVMSEIDEYFKGDRSTFQTPLCLHGTEFQKNVWNHLLQIPVGNTVSYADIAKQINQPTAYRAVANANGANPICIIVPCHRVILSSGELGGYGGRVFRKEWLIRHEKSFLS